MDKTLIYIYGETAQGKTTLAHSIPGYVISTDKAYNYMARVEQSPQSKFYLNTCHNNRNKLDFYTVHKVSSEDFSTVIIEGSTLASKKERDFIRKIFSPEKEIYLHLQHDDYEKRHKKKHGQPPQEWYRKWYKSIYTKPKGEIIITTDEEINNTLSQLI